MNIVFQLVFTGAPDADDNLAMQHIIFLENQRRAAANVQITLANIAAEKENLVRAAQKPPGEPVPILPLIPILDVFFPTDVKASYIQLVTEDLTNEHLANIALAKSITGFSARYTKEETGKIFANLTIPLNRGVAKEDVITDTDVIASKPAA